MNSWNKGLSMSMLLDRQIEIETCPAPLKIRDSGFASQMAPGGKIPA